MSVAYHDHILHLGGLAVPSLAEAIGTPFYAYDLAQCVSRLQSLQRLLAGLDAQICFAVKANPNTHVIRALARAGAGADITSYGEMRRAHTAGVSPADMVFSGVGKTREELNAALQLGVGQFNVESAAELAEIAACAEAHGVVAAVALRFNPDVEARTHPKIATGHLESKFGMARATCQAALATIVAHPSLAFRGFAVHVGSHLCDHSPFREAWRALGDLVTETRAAGIEVPRLDLGGGLGIAYDNDVQAPSVETYAALIREVVAPLGCPITLEPGRFLVADSGILVTRVVRLKESGGKRFVIVDAGMNDLIRPALYEARHSILPVHRVSSLSTPTDTPPLPMSVVGPVCETSDCFGDDYLLPPLQSGDLLAILQAGAYGSAMASVYNGRALIPEVVVENERFTLARRRIGIEEQLAWETTPRHDL